MAGRFEDVAVVGAGPAGVAAAVQLARYGLRPVVFERDVVGGLLRTAWLVENHPGFPGGIRGPELAGLIEEHLRASGAELVREEVVAVSPAEDLLEVRSEGETLLARTVIVASGTRPLALTDPAVPSDASELVSYESRELWGERDAAIAVIGGGDAALDYAIGLSGENDVTVIVRGDAPRGLPLLVSRLEGSRRVAIRTGARVSAITRTNRGRVALTVEWRAPGSFEGDSEGSESSEEFDRLLVAVGREPEDGFLDRDIVERRDELAAGNRLLFAGDVRSGVFRQASIAAGLGTLAAMRVALARSAWRASPGTEHS